MRLGSLEVGSAVGRGQGVGARCSVDPTPIAFAIGDEEVP